MKYFYLILLFIFIGCKSKSTTTSIEKNIIIPAYFYDSALWDRVIASDIKLVIFNPDNGPGTQKDPHYQDILTSLTNTNKIPIGYVYTNYSLRDINEVKEDIDKYLTFYPQTKGIFLDETSEKEENFNYYKELFDYIKSKGLMVILNPGTNTDKSYYNIADYIVTYEGEYTSIPSSTCQNPKDILITYNTPQDKMEEIIKNYNCPYFFITDKNPQDAYLTLPSYLDEEENLLK